MKPIITLLCFFFTFHSVFAQNIFQKAYGDTMTEVAYDVQRTFDGGYIMTGSSSSAHPFTSGIDLFLLKTDNAGNMQWRQTFGSTGEDRGFSVIQNADSGYSVLGYTLQPFRQNSDLYFLKTDANGNKLVSGYAGVDGVNTIPGPIISVENGNKLFTGTIENLTHTDFYVGKFDASENIVFLNSYGDSTLEDLRSIVQTYDQGYVFTGYSSNTFNASTAVVKIDETGAIVWSKIYSRTNDFLPIGMQQTPDSGLVIACSVYDTTSGFDFALFKTDALGNVLWARNYGSPFGAELAMSMVVLNNGNIVITGSTDAVSTAATYVIETDPEGNLLWSKIIHGIMATYAVTEGEFSSVVLAGTTLTYGAGLYDAALIVCDSLGNFGCNDSSFLTLEDTLTLNVTSSNLVIWALGDYGTAIADTLAIGIETPICTTTALPDLAAANMQFSVFPNPSKGNITVILPGNDAYGKLEIIDLLGQIIFSKYVSGEHELQINLEKITPGVHIMRFTDSKETYSSKVLFSK